MKRIRKSQSYDKADLDFYAEYARRKGIHGGLAGLIDITLHSYVARNKVKGLTPPWEAENEKGGAGKSNDDAEYGNTGFHSSAPCESETERDCDNDNEGENA